MNLSEADQKEIKQMGGLYQTFPQTRDYVIHKNLESPAFKALEKIAFGMLQSTPLVHSFY